MTSSATSYANVAVVEGRNPETLLAISRMGSFPRRDMLIFRDTLSVPEDMEL